MERDWKGVWKDGTDIVERHVALRSSPRWVTGDCAIWGRGGGGSGGDASGEEERDEGAGKVHGIGFEVDI